MNSAGYACKPGLRDYWYKRAFRALHGTPGALEIAVLVGIYQQPYSKWKGRPGCGCKGCYEVGTYLRQVVTITLWKLGVVKT